MPLQHRAHFVDDLSDLNGVVMLCPDRQPVNKKSPECLARHFDLIVDGVSGLLCQFKPDRTPGFSLAYSRSIDRIAIGGNVISPYGDNIAAPKLAVDYEI